MGTDSLPRRPENIVLTPDEQTRVLEQARRRGATCPSCGNNRFAVGDALYLGFLFGSEDPDAYLVALVCTETGCPIRHTGIRLPRRQFLSPTRPADARGESVPR